MGPHKSFLTQNQTTRVNVHSSVTLLMVFIAGGLAASFVYEGDLTFAALWAVVALINVALWWFSDERESPAV